MLLTGTGSGCGKTTITCAVLKAFKDRGLDTGAYKCGPDYIDTMFHARITGSSCTNLDPFFFDGNILQYLLSRKGASRRINIVEGVMGYYDGLAVTEKASTYEVAKATQTPVVLIVNAKGAAYSILAQINGFLDFCEDDQIRGVILNNCSPMLYPMIAETILKRFDGRVKPLGCMPSMSECSLESRHLGLVTAAEVEDLDRKLEILSGQAQKSIDLDGLLELADHAPELNFEEPAIRHFDEKIRIAVARDKAFCFYYEDSIDMLGEMGAEFVSFSPLNDSTLPEGIEGLYLGGGYPELYAERLSGNTSMLDSIKRAVGSGLPCIAECGGFMYLTAAIGDYKMCDVLPGKCYDTGRLTRFGYITLTANADNMLCSAGGSIRAHEFHHWDCEDTGNCFSAEKPTGRGWKCVAANDHLYAGFPHFHFLANLEFAEDFYAACVRYGRA